MIAVGGVTQDRGRWLTHKIVTTGTLVELQRPGAGIQLTWYGIAVGGR